MASSLSSDLSQDETGKKKGLLMRSNAMCGDDDTRLKSLDPQDRANSTGTARKKHFSAASSLSRDSSHTDFTDSTGIDLLHFIVSTLHKNAKDREMLLNLELEMRKFVLDKSRQVYKFPKMSSYNRMLVHRVAAFFGLDHNIDQSGTTVVVNKTPNLRVPDIEFSSCIKNNNFTDRVLSGRNVQSFDECRLDNFYSSFQPVAPNLAFGSAAALPIGMRVGEWHNSMAATGGGSNTGSATMLPGVPTAGLPAPYLSGPSGGGAAAAAAAAASSSNSSSSWQLASGVGSGVQYMPSRPEPMISPVSGRGRIILDSSSSYYSPANPPPKYISAVPYPLQQNELLINSPTLYPQSNNQNVCTESGCDTNEEGVEGVANAAHQFFVRGVEQPNVLPLPANYSVGSIPYWSGGGGIPFSEIAQQQQFGNYPIYQTMNNGQPFPVYQQLSGLPQQQQGIQYDNLHYPTGRLNLVPATQELTDHFQQSLQISSNPADIRTNPNSLGAFVSPCFVNPGTQFIPINTPNGTCFVPVGVSFVNDKKPATETPCDSPVNSNNSINVTANVNTVDALSLQALTTNSTSSELLNNENNGKALS